MTRQKEEERDTPSLSSSSLLREREIAEVIDDSEVSSKEIVQGIVDNLIDNVVLGLFSYLYFLFLCIYLYCVYF